MDDPGKRLTSDEVGAFTAQWAERYPVTLQELVQILDVSESEVESIRRQANGRLSMERWLQQGKAGPASRSSKLKLNVIAPVVLVAVALGAIYLRQTPSENDRSYIVNPSAGFKPPISASTAIAQITSRSPATYEVTSVPPGSQSPSEQAGKEIGANLANEVMSGVSSSSSRVSHLPMVAGNRPSPGIGPRSGSGAGFPIMPFQHPPLPIVDLSAKLKIPNTPFPNDLFIEVQSPTITYRAKGEVKGDLVSAQKIDRGSISMVLDRMIQLILHKELDPNKPDSEPTAAWANVQLRIGVASSHAPIHWVKADRMKIQNMFKDPDDPLLSPLLQPILEKIQDAGSSLFASNRRK